MPKSRIDIIGQNGNDGLHYVEACQHPVTVSMKTSTPHGEAGPLGCKYCPDCNTWLAWECEEGKPPIGWGFDRELQKITHRTE